MYTHADLARAAHSARHVALADQARSHQAAASARLQRRAQRLAHRAERVSRRAERAAAQARLAVARAL